MRRPEAPGGPPARQPAPEQSVGYRLLLCSRPWRESSLPAQAFPFSVYGEGYAAGHEIISPRADASQQQSP